MDAASRRYGAAQTAIFCVYAAAYLLVPGPVLFAGGAPRVAGAVLCAAGLLLMLASVWTLRRVIQVAPEPRADAHLVTRGPYAALRHPIYTGILLVVAGLCLRHPTWLVVALTLGVFAYLALKVQLEERLLLARYPGYADYRARSWGLVPGFGRARAGRAPATPSG